MVWIALYFVGIFSNILIYDSISPAIVSLIFAFFVCAIITIFFYKDKLIWPSIQVYCILTFWHGVASAYGLDAHGPDAIDFYEVAISGLSFNEMLLMENGAAILLFGFIYNIFSYIGLQPGHYIGSMLNVMLVTISFIVGYRILSVLTPITRRKFFWYKVLYITSGMFMLFAALHLREALVQLSFTLLVLFWASIIEKPSIKKIIVITLLSIAVASYFKLLRTEFYYIPIVVMASAYLSIFFSDMSKNIKTILATILFLTIVYILASNYQGVASYFDQLNSVVLYGAESYKEGAALESSTGSLGNMLIVQQPLYLRVFIGTIYLFISPFPFYNGLFSSSAYHFFKSIHAMQMIFVLPYFLLTLINMLKNNILKNSTKLFITTLFVGFSVSVAITSLETRHHGVFLLLMYVLMVAYGPRWRVYKDFLLIYVTAITVLITTHAVIKYL